MKKSMPLLAVTLLAASTFALSTTTTKAVVDDVNNESTADFTVTVDGDPDDPDPDPGSGKLILKSVPTFRAGNLSISKIYNGFNTGLEQADDLIVADNRVKEADWSLDLNMGTFTEDEGANTLTGATLAFTAKHGVIGQNNVSLSDGGSGTVLSNNAAHHGDFTLAITDPTLSMNANGSASIAEDSHYAATLDWTLSSGSPVAEEL
ncbi:WxL domain-containing protein [Lapidilactobacillus salsurivasis]